MNPHLANSIGPGNMSAMSGLQGGPGFKKQQMKYKNITMDNNIQQLTEGSNAPSSKQQ